MKSLRGCHVYQQCVPKQWFYLQPSLCLSVCDCVNSYIVLSGGGLQHSSEETVGKGEARQPEQVGGVARLCPPCKLINALAKIPGPRCQGLQRWVRLGRDRHTSTVTSRSSNKCRLQINGTNSNSMYNC